MEQPIATLGLSARTYSALREFYKDIDQIENITDGELLTIPQFGPKMLKEVRDRLAVYHGERLPEGRVLEGVTAMGGELCVYISSEDSPCVAWAGCPDVGDISFYTETREEAQALFTAMLKIKDIHVD